MALVFSRIRQIRRERYMLLRQVFPGGDALSPAAGSCVERLHAVELPAEAWMVGRCIKEPELEKGQVILTAIQRQRQWKRWRLNCCVSHKKA